MKTFANLINPTIVDDPIQRKYWEYVRQGFQEISIALSRSVTRGNLPTAVPAGDDTFNALNYLYLPGRAGGQRVYGGLSSTDILRLIGTKSTAGTRQVLFGDTDGQGVSIFAAGGSLGSAGRIGVNVSSGSIAASVHIFAESGAAPAISIRPSGTATGDAIFVSQPGGGVATFNVTSNGLMNLVSYAGQASVDLFTISNISGNANTVPLTIIAKSGQAGNLVEWQDNTTAVMSRITPTGAFDGPITTTSAVSVTDSVFSILDNVTPSKIAQFECASLTAGTNTFTFPNTTAGTLAMVNLAQTFTKTQTFRTDVSAGVSLVVQRNSGAGAANIMNVLNNAGSIIAAFNNAGRFSLDPAAGIPATPTGIFNVSMNSMTVPAINSLFTIDVSSSGTSGLWRFVPTLTDTGVGGAGVTCLRVAPTISTSGTTTAIESATIVLDDPGGSGLCRAMNFTVDLASLTNPTGQVQGMVGSINYGASSANIAAVYAVSASAIFSGSGTVTDLRMLNVAGNINSGTFTEAFGIWLDVGGNCSTTGTVKGFYINDISHGGVQDANTWCLYFASPAQSWISGNVGIGGSGVTTPAARLHLAAGTATAGTAPLRFISGTSLTVAVAGTMEFTTDDLFFTITTGTARKAFILDDGSRLTLGKVPKATTNGRLIDGSSFVGTPVVVGDDPPAVASGALGKVDLTGQTADIGSTNLTNSPSTGCYRLSCVLEDTTADVTAGTVTATFSWTDDSGAKTATVAQALIALGSTQLDQVIYIASGNLSYATTHTGIFGTSAYAIRIRVEALT